MNMLERFLVNKIKEYLKGNKDEAHSALYVDKYIKAVEYGESGINSNNDFAMTWGEDGKEGYVWLTSSFDFGYDNTSHEDYLTLNSIHINKVQYGGFLEGQEINQETKIGVLTDYAFLIANELLEETIHFNNDSQGFRKDITRVYGRLKNYEENSHRTTESNQFMTFNIFNENKNGRTDRDI